MTYINEINDVILSISTGDFSKKIQIRGDNDALDSIANGINMLSEELDLLIRKRDTYESLLNERISNLQASVDLTTDDGFQTFDLMREVDELRKKLDLKPKYLH